ncbi:MAG TPA: serine/threonine-protein kinase, partial [Ktedonobacterales bacterium]
MAQPSTQSTLAPGTPLQRRYRIEQMIGSGGYATVYRARDMQSGEEYAIKEVVDPDPAVRKQFQIEAELLIHAPHQNIPQGYDYFDEKGRMYLVMEYVRGKDLEELLNDSLVHTGKALDEAQVLTWMIQICDALVEMHTQPVPIIHRDIKPANIKITTNGRPVLIDFGLAKQQRAGNPTMTAAQGVSPGFAPPEQYMAKGKTDQRTDIYGLGATLYACLTGKDPQEAPERLLAQTGTRSGGGKALIPARKINPRISEATDRLITKSLELSPMQRQQSARSMRTELRAALAVLTGAATTSMRAAPGESGKRAAVGANGPAGGSNPRARAVKAAAAGAAQSWPQGPAGNGAGRTGKQPAAAVAGRTAKQAAVGTAVAERRTGKQPAANANTAQHLALPPLPTPLPSAAAMQQRRNGQQPAMMEPRLGAQAARQPVVAPRMDGRMDGRMDFNPALGLAGAAGAVTVNPGAPLGARSSGSPARAGRRRSVGNRPWIWLGDQQLNKFGKWMLA